MEALSYCQLMERCLAAEARVVELEYGKVGDALLEREKHHVEVVRKLTEHIAELTAENVALKSKGKELLGEACAVYSRLNTLIDPSIGDFADGQTLHEFQFVLDVETPATDRIVAAQRSAFVDEAVAKITESGALTFGDCIVALCQLRESAK